MVREFTYLCIEVLMYEPSCEGDAGTAEPEVRGEDVGEADLETLLQQVDEDHDGDGGVELVQEGEAEVEHEDDRGRQEAQQLPGQHPASQRQRQRLKLQQAGVATARSAQRDPPQTCA